MKIAEVFQTQEKGVSFEFFPAKTPEGLEQLVKVAQELETYGPLYASVTYGAGGTTQDRTKETLYELREKTGMNLMSHLTCVGATRELIGSLLEDYAAHGIDNILALRGDPPHDMYEFDREKGEFQYAKDLVEFIKPYGKFSISVAVYPEGHPEAPSLEKDIEFTKLKIAAGADFAITQMFFDNSYFFDFMEKAGKAGIDIPVFPGIMPITDFAKIKKFASFCQATIPDSVEKALGPLQDKPDEMFKKGVELAVKQCEELIANGVDYLHFYTLNQSATVKEILASVRP